MFSFANHFLLVALVTFVIAADPIEICLQSITTGSGFIDLRAIPGSPNRFFLASKGGKIELLDGTSRSTIFSIPVDSGGERGLLTIVPHPKFATNKYLFTMYSHPSTQNNIVSRWTIASDFKSANNELRLMNVDQPAGNHNGGYMGFSNHDGYLYITFGDGGSGNDLYNKGQNTGDVLGSIIRIDVDSTANGKNYAIPSDNPYNADNDANTLGEIFVDGLRNPFRCSFDRSDNTKLYCGDVVRTLGKRLMSLTLLILCRRKRL